MKVLMINSVCGILSTGRICTDIAEILETHGHTCKIAYGRNHVPAKYEKYAVRIGSDLDVKMHAAQARAFDNSALASKKATKAFISWIKEYDPDIIHLHNIHGYYINFEILFSYLRATNKPVVWTMHDCWPFTGHCAYFDYADCQKWKTGCGRCPQKHKYPASYGLDLSAYNFKAKDRAFTSLENLVIVTPSKWLAQLVEQSFLGKYPIKTIYNGIDLSKFKPTLGNTVKLPADKKIVLGVASGWEERKGLSDFFKLADILSDDYRVMLVGLTEKQKSELPTNIIGITRTDNVSQLAELYTRADVFVNLTYEDNYPTTNLEAQACGTPVITYATGGSSESVLEPGAVVEQGNIDKVYKEIQRIVQQGPISFDTDDFSSEIKYLEYIKLYEDLLENKQ